jgi:hypothetical protein
MSQGQVKMTAKIDRSKDAFTVTLEFKGRPIGHRPTRILDFSNPVTILDANGKINKLGHHNQLVQSVDAGKNY